MSHFANFKFYKTLLILTAFVSASAAVIVYTPGGWLQDIKQNVYTLFEEDFEFAVVPGNVIHVDLNAGGTNDGTSWINAYTDLQDALQSAAACDTIKVAQGTYFPDRGTADRDSTFFIPDSITLLGGYQGVTGDTLEPRNWVCNPTFLFGNIGDPNDSTDNSIHVVTTINTGTLTWVDGFTISCGIANGMDAQTTRGGGWYNIAQGGGVSSPIIRNCTFESNFAVLGGGLANIAEDGVAVPDIYNSVFRGNTGGLDIQTSGGAAIYSGNHGGTANLIVVNSIFSGNHTDYSGSAILLESAPDSVHLTMINSVVNGNTSSAIYHNFQGVNSISTDIINSIFWNNNNDFDYNDDTEIRIKNSIIEYESEYIDLGGNKYSVNPYFIEAPFYFEAPTLVGDFHLLPISPAINMGSNAEAPSEDIEGNTRPANGTVEIGPYELAYSSCDLYNQQLYVDSSVALSGDGLSWATAFKTLVEALEVTRFCDQVDTIHVARGTYFPTDTFEILDPCTGMLSGTIDYGREGTFNIPDGLVVLGGYEGLLGDTSAPRNWECNKTILSGDIGVFEDNTDNSYHVVTTIHVDSTTVVDGFCIVNGYADGLLYFDNKGGAWINYGSGTGNLSNPTIRNCILANNNSIDHGGAMYNFGSEGGTASPTFINCKIIDNTCGQNGGGIYNEGSLGESSPVFINCIISGNSTLNSRGGGIYNEADEGESSPVLINCILSGNYAPLDGGGMYNNASEGTSSPVLTNCIIYGNNCGGDGGGLYNNAYEGTSSPVLTNCIIGNNSGFGTGRNFYNFPDINGIVAPVVSYSLIEDDYFSLTNGCSDCVDTSQMGNKYNTDPQFKFPLPSFIAPTSGGDFHLLPTSLAINMGLNAANSWPIDLGGDDRIQAGTIDIGPYEFSIPSCDSFENILYVDASVDSLNTGTDWAHALNDLQLALVIARFCDIDTIKVAQGTYYPIDSTSILDACGNIIEDLGDNRTVSFNIPNGVVVMGGYPIGGGSEDQRDWNCNKTILCGDIGIPGDNMDNTYHVVITTNVDSTTVVDGFCIRDGYANDGFENEGSESGAGWLNFGNNGGYSNPTIINCAIIDNYSSRYGGGMANLGDDEGNASPKLINCIISGNETEEKGGGLYNDGDDDGNASPVLINCILSGNYQENEDDDYGGGAVYNDAEDGTSSPVFINCVISGNQAYHGGAVFNNEADGTCKPVFTNCILWNNDDIDNDVFYNSGGASPVVSYSILQGNDFIGITSGNPVTDGNNNKFEGSGINPDFINAPTVVFAPTSAGNFNVLPGSDAIDMGLDSANTYPVDFAGNGRIQNDSIDIGAYEYQPLDCGIYTTGLVYVDSSAAGDNNGTSWVHAFTDLQDALEAARYCNVDTIRVAQGTYYPFQYIIFNECGVPDTITEVDRTVSFDIPDSTVVMGGYPVGGGTDGERDWVCNKTILCGDIGIPGDSSDNSYHVVTTFDVDSVTVVDGFCIRDGFADFPDGHPANSGGGWFNRSFENGYSNPRILNCTFLNNEAIADGGALYNDAGGSGTTLPYIYNCAFYENNAAYGGAIYNFGGYSGNSSPTIINSIISGNQANVQGGGMSNNGGEQGNANPLIVNCIFSGNSSLQDGGAMFNHSDNSGVCSPQVINTTFSGNLAVMNGGAILSEAFSQSVTAPFFYNCIFWNNIASNGPVFFNTSSQPSVSYSIIQDGGMSDDINHASITLGDAATIDVEGNKFNTDPLFVFAPAGLLAPTTAGDFHLAFTSPAIDMGLDIVNNEPFDLDGNTRIQADSIDIGPYEVSLPVCGDYGNVIYVDISAAPGGNGKTWDSAFTNLQDALAVVNYCNVDSIFVAQGTYYPYQPFNSSSCNAPVVSLLGPRDATFNIPDSAVLLGGFPIGGGGLETRDWICNKTILCGDIGVPGDSSDNSFHVVTTLNVDSVTLVDGFCIQDGNADDQVIDIQNRHGAGWYNASDSADYSNPVLRNITFINNHAAFRGGGMYNNGADSGNASPKLINCHFLSNTALTGGGIYNQGDSGKSSPYIINTVFAGNTAGNEFENGSGGATVNRGRDGGESNPLIINCIFSGNWASFSGGAMNNDADGLNGMSNPIIINTTFNGNRAVEEGGVMANRGDDVNNGICVPVMINCIFWNNEAGVSGPVFYNSNSEPEVSFSILQGGGGVNDINDGSITGNDATSDEGNNKFDENPLFINSPVGGDAPTTAGNFHVLFTSPAIDMGLDSVNNQPFDLDGGPRIQNDSIDIGAYESVVPDCNLYLAGVIYVDSAAIPGRNGSTWDSAFTDLQDALAVAAFCGVDSIFVAQGTYYPSQTIINNSCPNLPPDTIEGDRNASFNIPESTIMLGGFPVGGGTLEERNWICNKTILCGEIQRDGDSSNNSYTIVKTFNVGEVLVDGFCIRDGFNNEEEGLNRSGGWYNAAIGDGENDFYSLLLIRNCVFINNVAGSGGAFFNYSEENGEALGQFVNCQFRGNRAFQGGAIMNYAFDNGTAYVNFFNSILSGNGLFSDDLSGAAIHNEIDGGNDCAVNLTNSAVCGNFGPDGQSAVWNNSTVNIYNSIFWNNTASIKNEDGGTTAIFYSIMQLDGFVDPNTSGVGMDGNKDAGTDPLFVNAPSAGIFTNGDYHVMLNSPAINMGDNGYNSEDLDLDNLPRIQQDTIDIGPYEFQPPDCGLYTQVVYVDSSATPGGNGSSWDSAFTSLSEALEIARFCSGVDTILVAQGTYYPADTVFVYEPCTGAPVDTILPDRNATFEISDSLVVLGGFPVGGGTFEEREWVCNKTILCGDINIPGDSSDNSFHVVTTTDVDSMTLVDGFYIMYGFNTGEGGGWLNLSSVGDSSKPTIVNCTFSYNYSTRGGAMFNNGENGGNSSPTLINCVISGNSAIEGGGIFNAGEAGKSSPLIINSLLTGNSAQFLGGAMVNDGENGGNSSPRIINCVFSGNLIYGGGSGAAMYNNGNTGTCMPLAINCIFWNNDHGPLGTGPVFSNSSATPTVSYSILQGISLNDPTVTDGDPNNDGGSNLFIDPVFIYALPGSAAPTTLGDFHTKYSSQAIDMGDDLANNHPVDLDGDNRVQHGRIDIGAYEFKSFKCSPYASGVVYVDSSASGANNGSSWNNAFTDLQDALVVARFCADTVKVAQGTYYPSRPDTLIQCGDSTFLPISRHDFFFIPNSTVMLGGYPTGGSEEAWRMPHCNLTIMSGDIDHDGDSSGNSYNVVKTINYNDTILYDGFVIEQGNAIPIGEEGGGWWDGSFNDSAKLIIRQTIFRNNYAVQGGAFYGEGTRDLMMNQSEFYLNAAVNEGGGAYVGNVLGPDTAFIRMENLLWHHNEASSGGGLAGFVIATPPDVIDIVNNTFTLNSPDAYSNNSSDIVRILNTIIWNNNGGTISGSNIPTIFNTIMEGIALSNGNKDTDPLFQDPVGNFHLSQASPAIDMGENSFSMEATDLDGLPRIARTIIDMGVYENILYCYEDTIYVNADGSLPINLEDSILKAAIPLGFEVTYNGGDSTVLDLTCANLGANSFYIQLLRSCDQSLIDSCTLNLFLADTFSKNLVCNNKVNVSLGAGCVKLITPEDVLENIRGCVDAFYDIQLVYPLGTHKFPPANDLVDESHIGYTMVYSVYETLTGNKCWGYLKVEDKLPPLLNCIDDTIACYELPDLPLLASNEDDCSDGKVELISDEWFDYGCDSVLSGYVIRTIQGTDRWGNFRRCTSVISIERTVLDSVVCPDLVELPCEIRTQIGGGKTLKTPIVVDQSKVTPAYLLSLQKRIWEFTDNTKDWILNPSVRVVPQIKGQNIWPGAGGICKINSLYKDSRLDVCGTGFKIYREWTIVDWCGLQDTTCVQYIKVTDTEQPEFLTELYPLEYNASAHDCVASVTIPALVAGKDFRDCNGVDQTYILSYNDPSHPGKIIVLTGSLPSVKIHLPLGEYTVDITLVDKCQNRMATSRDIYIYDITPPTPVCDEFTQVTLDPVTCWARIAAKDLDNGSRDNCCDVLHFAAASMDSITYWTNYWNTKLETEVGKEAFWHDKANYDAIIENWINCYVFADSILLTDCGNSQIVLRVYEACGVPIRDPHIFPCSEHAWFCYNTYLYIGDFNFNWFDPNGPHSCAYRPELTSLAKMDLRYAGYETKGYLKPKYVGATQFIYCDVPFYFPVLAHSSGGTLVPGTYCSFRQYSDCMINVLVDDKQAPVVAELEDVIVYCDRAPENAYAPNCMGGEEFNVWPGLLKDKKGVEHGYYGGSDFLGIHLDEHETADPCGYDNAHHWAPIYCRSWLYLDSFDSAGKIDPKQYFETLVLFDKIRPARTLLAKEFSITDNCRLDTTTLAVSDEGTLNGCGEGWIQRTWTIQDKCGNTVTAKQKVVVKHRSDFEVIFPEDKVVECDFLNTTDPKDAGEPIISDDECEHVGVQYKDEVFTVEDSACYKIVRTWTLIDWCIYNPNAQFHYSDVIVDDRLRADTGNRSCVYRHLKDNNDGYMKYIQVIKVIDKVAPTVTTRDTTICIYSEDCKSALVRIPFNATDNCTATSELSYRVEVDLNATSTVFTNRTYVKSSIDQTTQSNQVEFVYSPSVAGKHVVHVIVKDNCGNEDTSSYRFELVDCKKPTPHCYNGVATVIMPSTGKITVWAKDLDAGSFDNCTLAANLKFSFSSNASETSKEFSCTDIPDGKSKTIPVDIWVTDEAGNQDHCSTYILLQDNSGNICPDVAGLSVTIAGKIQTETNEPVEHVRVNIYGGALQMNYQTGIKGTYHFEGLPSKSNYSLKSTRDDQPMNGVSTLDLVLIQKHILGVELLNSPYKILAADIDNDKQVTAIDLVELRKLILATYDELPNNESWKFIPKSTTFNDVQNPWNTGAVSDVMEMKDVIKDHMTEDFIGYKVGDVNATAAPHSLMGVEVRGNETGLLFEVTDQVFKRGDVVRVDFRSPNFRGISGWQGTLSVARSEQRDASLLSGLELIPGSLDMKRENLGMRYANQGMLTMSWNTNSKSGMDIDEQQVLFTLVFKAQENGKLSEVLRIGSQHTIAESYQGKGELGNLGIRFVQNGNEIVAKSELYQNYPNPFDQRTVIGINLAGQGKGTLKVYDATGRTIKSVERDWTKGYHEVWFDRKEIGSTGVLYYRFESGFFNASKKMILID